MKTKTKEMPYSGFLRAYKEWKQYLPKGVYCELYFDDDGLIMESNYDPIANKKGYLRKFNFTNHLLLSDRISKNYIDLSTSLSLL